MRKTYDLIIVGGGPAGITASIFASRFSLDHALITKILGGAVLEAIKIENYPGFPSISGLDLVNSFETHLLKFKPKIIYDEVVKIGVFKNFFELETRSKNKFKTLSLILALGLQKKTLKIGEEKFLGKGVSYCVICDASFFKNRKVALIAKPDLIDHSLEILLNWVKKVYLILEKKKDLKFFNRKKVEIIEGRIKKVEGKDYLEGILFENGKRLKVDGLFIELGGVPSSLLIKELKLETDKNGFIKINEKGETSIPGIFAAGDITTGSGGLKQIITAAAEGAIAASSAYKFLKKLR